MSFGFGIGDFIAMGNVAYSAYSALRESTGSAAEFQSLVNAQRGSRWALDQAKAQLSLTRLESAVQNAINHHIDSSLSQLDAFDKLIEPFTASLGTSAGTGSWTRDTGKKLKWKRLQGDISKLHTTLMQHKNAIELIINVHTVAVANNNHAVLKRLEKATVPAKLGDETGWISDYKPIRFIDALNDRFPVPYDLCNSWDVRTTM
ncbi:hypothetical protein EDC01DRAFT_356537 [Geopyxis carbonaria]|nr:hypothetical protein EDC01DRAFT_356537 [Geopyxis carbonaria]